MDWRAERSRPCYQDWPELRQLQGVIKQINEFLVDNRHDVYRLKTYGNVVENIVDLFSLSYCSFLIKSNKSTWSEFAEDYRHQPALDATNSIDKIIEKYIKIFTK
jgi:hypothetical protein